MRGTLGMSVLLAVLGSLSVAFLGFAARSAYRHWLFRRPFSRIWNHGDQDTVYLVNGVVEDGTSPEEGRFKLDVGDFIAHVSVAQALEKHHSKLRIKNLFSKQLSGSDMMKEHIVSIGGPKRNQVTRDLMEKLGSRFAFEDGKLVDKKTGKKYSPQYREEGDFYEVDYGLIIKGYHSTDPSKVAFLFAGCHTEGTLGVASYLSALNRGEEATLRQLAREFRREGFEIAVKCMFKRDSMDVIFPMGFERVA